MSFVTSIHLIISASPKLLPPKFPSFLPQKIVGSSLLIDILIGPSFNFPKAKGWEILDGEEPLLFIAQALVNSLHQNASLLSPS